MKKGLSDLSGSPGQQGGLPPASRSLHRTGRQALQALYCADRADYFICSKRPGRRDPAVPLAEGSMTGQALSVRSGA